MKNINLLFKWLIVSLILQSVILYIVLGLIFIPKQKICLRQTLIDRVKFTTSPFIPLIKEGLTTRDDIAIMKLLVNIAHQPEFIYSRIIDSTGKVLAHNEIHQWGRSIDKKFLKRLNQITDSIVLERKNPRGYDFVIPIVLSNTKIVFFSTGILSEKTEKQITENKTQIVQSGVLLLVVSVSVSLLFFYFIVISPLKKLQLLIKSIILGKPGERVEYRKKDEFGKLCNLINKYIAKMCELLEKLKYPTTYK